MSNHNNLRDITVTIIFEGSALNRDEKIGGNIQSIKKLTVGNKVVSFISRSAIRHYMFNTLVKSFPNDWKPAAITGQGSVAQFDILQHDIISSAELDVFGYMYTIGGENSLTRKAPLGITKAISLHSYNQDMAFYTNHDLVQRGNQNGLNITPNPFQREEHTSLYKLSFTIDSKILGEDSWVVSQKPRYEQNILKINISTNEKTINNITLKEGGQDEYEIKDNNEVSGTIKIKEINNNLFKIYLKLSNDIKKRRICQILTAIHNGLVAHSSGEDNTIVPLFLIAAPVKVPSPVFHPYIDIVMEDGNPRIIGINDCIQNSWVEDQFNQNGSKKVKKVYIKECDRLKIIKDEIKENLFDSWEDFLKACGLENRNCVSHSQ